MFHRGVPQGCRGAPARTTGDVPQAGSDHSDVPHAGVWGCKSQITNNEFFVGLLKKSLFIFVLRPQVDRLPQGSATGDRRASTGSATGVRTTVA